MATANPPLNSAAIDAEVNKQVAAADITAAVIKHATELANEKIQKRVARVQNLMDREKQHMDGLNNMKAEPLFFDADGKPILTGFTLRQNQDRIGYRRVIKAIQIVLTLVQTDNSDEAWKKLSAVNDGDYFIADEPKK